MKYTIPVQFLEWTGTGMFISYVDVIFSRYFPTIIYPSDLSPVVATVPVLRQKSTPCLSPHYSLGPDPLLGPHRSTMTSYSCLPSKMMGKKWIWPSGLVWVSCKVGIHHGGPPEGVHRNDLLLVLFGSEVRTHRGSCRYFRRFWKALPPHLGMQKNGEAGDH